MPVPTYPVAPVSSTLISSSLQHDCEALADADADRDDSHSATETPQLVGRVTEDACTGRAERVSDGDGTAVNVNDRGSPTAHREAETAKAHRG